MSAYTGRYPRSHGSTANAFPLRVGEMTLGDHLRPMGHDTVLIGKTHMRADVEGMERFGVSPDTIIGARLSECGFDTFERDDGLHYVATDPAYNQHLHDQGHTGDNPWLTAANSVAPETVDETGNGWLLKYSDRPALVPEPDSETPYLTRRFIDFLDSRAGQDGWLCHLSFIKPHWPYIAPASYHNMYGPDSWVAPTRDNGERADPHPVYGAFMNQRVSKAFSRDEVRETVLPAYMGLIKQIDDQMGLLFAELKARGLWDKTLIVFTSDHGDYLGDHWMGEKDLFHEPSVKVPLIIRDPRPNALRGQISDALVEAIDLAPTFVDALGGDPAYQWFEGRSLLPLLEGSMPEDWRDVAFSEYDYSVMDARRELDQEISDCRIVMACDARWKLFYFEGFRPMLFDLENDPDELHDLGNDPAYAGQCEHLTNEVFAWYRRGRQRVTVTDAQVSQGGEAATVAQGVIIGFWDEDELRDFKDQT
nr:sulfatase-like hydrolase/transferase [Rhodophyticola sp. CCM32]